ncbi:ketopantoate reductase family protein [Citricoccus muralis]|uniref:2-dehydropantoate 2-reductase n=1 Tax=Citricoccus muralis TaxID=169134 RepID=A0ABY8H5V2_9MICC|nr:2-dehydropantoate 2-reductase [Citricoccus muralis]WFP16229.1 2-dehydropantoate 2-reductase [Citricoccus muralis]
MTIAILGAGAMGQLFGARLAAAGNTVTMIDVDADTVAALNTSGITVTTPMSSFTVPVLAAQAQDLTDSVDLVLVFTKGSHTSDALDSIRHVVDERTVGLTLQNGVGNERAIINLLGEDRTLMGMTSFPADRKSLTEIGTVDSGAVILGDAALTESPSELAEQTATLLHSAGLQARSHPDVRVPIWEKLIFNAVMNTIGGATGLTVGDVGRLPETQQWAEEIIRESLTVAGALDIAISEQRIRATLTMAYREHADHLTSMTEDVLQGRDTEVETIGGAILSVAEAHGLPSPVLRMLCDVIRLRTLASKNRRSIG